VIWGLKEPGGAIGSSLGVGGYHLKRSLRLRLRWQVTA